MRTSLTVWGRAEDLGAVALDQTSFTDSFSLAVPQDSLSTGLHNTKKDCFLSSHLPSSWAKKGED